MQGTIAMAELRLSRNLDNLIRAPIRALKNTWKYLRIKWVDRY